MARTASSRRSTTTAFTITVNDCYQHIATVTVHSAIYREYLHLVKTPAGWKIFNALYSRTEFVAQACRGSDCGWT
jgi:hypothetical protein